MSKIQEQLAKVIDRVYMGLGSRDIRVHPDDVAANKSTHNHVRFASIKPKDNVMNFMFLDRTEEAADKHLVFKNGKPNPYFKQSATAFVTFMGTHDGLKFFEGAGTPAYGEETTSEKSTREIVFRGWARSEEDEDPNDGVSPSRSWGKRDANFLKDLKKLQDFALRAAVEIMDSKAPECEHVTAAVDIIWSKQIKAEREAVKAATGLTKEEKKKQIAAINAKGNDSPPREWVLACIMSLGSFPFSHPRIDAPAADATATAQVPYVVSAVKPAEDGKVVDPTHINLRIKCKVFGFEFTKKNEQPAPLETLTKQEIDNLAPEDRWVYMYNNSNPGMQRRVVRKDVRMFRLGANGKSRQPIPFDEASEAMPRGSLAAVTCGISVSIFELFKGKCWALKMEPKEIMHLVKPLADRPPPSGEIVLGVMRPSDMEDIGPIEGLDGDTDETAVVLKRKSPADGSGDNGEAPAAKRQQALIAAHGFDDLEEADYETF